MLRSLFVFSGFSILLACCASANAQSLLAESSSLDFQGLTKAHRGRAVAGQVCVLRGKVTNSGDQLEAANLVATIDGRFDLVTVRAIEVEPRDSEVYELQIRLPENIEGRVKIEVALKKQINGTEVFLVKDGKPIVSSVELPLENRSFTVSQALAPNAAVFPDWFWPPVEFDFRSDYELLVGSQVEAGQKRFSVGFEAEGVPLDFAEWNGVDLLIISDDHVLQDAASTHSIRRFLEAGGRVWMMLDRAPCSQVRQLLNNDQSLEQIDEVQVYRVVMDLPAKGMNYKEEDRTVVSDSPLLLKRVVQSGGEVTHSANSWPASITYRIGFGELIVTTLDCSAWMESRQKPYSADPQRNSLYRPIQWASPHVADTIFSDLGAKPQLEESEYALDLLGSPIVPKSWVTLALIVFCILLAGLSAWRSTAGDLSRMGYLTPAVALLLSLGLLGSKAFVSSGTDPGTAKLQVVEISQDGNSAEVTEIAANNLPGGGKLALSYENDGYAQPVDSMGTGIHRSATNDFQEWTLTNDAWPSGLWRYKDFYHLDLDQQIAEIELTEFGCEISLPDGSAQSMEDAVLIYAAGHPMLCDASDERLFSDGETRIGDQKWLASTLLSDEQKRRSEVYRAVLEADSDGIAPDKVLYGWTELWGGPQWSGGLGSKGHALVRMPVRVLRPAVGEQVLVPYGLIALRQNQSQLGTSGAFDDQTGRWRSEQSSAMDRRLQFVLPKAIVPFNASKIQLTLDLKAPQREVIISVEGVSGEVELARLDSPSIPWNYTITSPEILNSCKDGVLDIRVQVSDRQGGNSSSVVHWQIDYFDATAEGSLDES